MHTRYRLILFDFDGTLADSFPWVLNIMDELADRYHLPRIERSQIDQIRRLDPARLIREHRIPLWKLAAIGKDVRHMMARDIAQIRLFPGIENLLQALADQGSQLGMITSNGCANVRQVLGAQNAALMRYYACGASLFGKHTRIARVVKESGVPPSETIMIGDEIRDIAAAHKAGIASGAVAWGYGSYDSLLAHSPTESFETVQAMARRLAWAE